MQDVALDRDRRRLGQRPFPPRPVSLIEGVLLWSPPKNTANVTQYHVYNTEGQLFASVPASQKKDQLKLVGVDTERVFISSYDDRSKMESLQAPVTGTVATGASAPTEYLLAASSTNITALGTGTDGEVRYVVIETDGTAGRQIVWDATFKGVTADDIVNPADWTNIYGFLCRNTSEWWNISRIHYATP